MRRRSGKIGGEGYVSVPVVVGAKLNESTTKEKECEGEVKEVEGDVKTHEVVNR